MSAPEERSGSEHQLAEWLEGRSWHNPTNGGECCPDFSCCRPDLLWSAEVRREFVNANAQKRDQMLMMSLGAALAAMGKRDATYIAGMDGEVES